MYAQKLETLPPPPGVIGSLKAGFEAVSSHVILISIPFLVDVFLWLGPRLGVSKVLGPVYDIFFNQLRKGLSTQDEVKQLVAFQNLFTEGLQHFNLVSLASRLQTFPVGISSLMAKTMPVDTPMGLRNWSQLASPLSLAGYMFLLIVIGWMIGALYFRWVSGAVLSGRGGYVSIPHDLSDAAAVCPLAHFSGFHLHPGDTFPGDPVFDQSHPGECRPVRPCSGLVLAGGAFFFMPLGIFVRGQNAFRSIFSSFRMVRFTFPSSGVVCVHYLYSYDRVEFPVEHPLE